MITKIYTQRMKKDLLRLAVLSLITAVVWLGVSTYRTLRRPQVAPDVKKLLQPLTTTLPLDTMDQVNQRHKAPAIDWDQLGQTGNILVATGAAGTIIEQNETTSVE